MTTLCDYHFKDGENIQSYFLRVSEEYPGKAVIKNGILRFSPATGFAGELIFEPAGLMKDTRVRVTLYGAKGEGALDESFLINNTSYADVSGDVSVNSFRSFVLLTRDDRPFEFKGYKVELA